MDDAFIYTSRGPYRQYKLLVRGESVTGFDTIPHRTPRREGFRRVKTAGGQLGRTAAFRLLQRPQSWRVDNSPTRGPFHQGATRLRTRESDLDTNVVRTLKQPEGCGPSEVFHMALRVQLTSGPGFKSLFDASSHRRRKLFVMHDEDLYAR